MSLESYSKGKREYNKEGNVVDFSLNDFAVPTLISFLFQTHWFFSSNSMQHRCV